MQNIKRATCEYDLKSSLTHYVNSSTDLLVVRNVSQIEIRCVLK